MATFYNQATLSYNDTTVNSNIVSGEIVEALTVTKTAIPETYSPGDTITYVVTVINSQEVPITGITLTDDLGAYTFDTASLIPLTYVDGTAAYFSDGEPQSAPAVSVTAAGALEITGITVPAGGNAVIVYQAETNEYASPAPDQTITNTITVTGGAAPASASATITSESAVALSISKSVSPAEVVPGGSLTYSFIIQNTGSRATTAEDNVIVTDTFDPVLSNISVSFDNIEKAVGYTYNETTGEFVTSAGAITVPAATYTQDPATGAWSVVPGTATLTVTGTV